MQPQDEVVFGLRPSLWPLVGAVSGVVYAIMHGWWTVAGHPAAALTESVFVAGWPLVITAATASLICAGIGLNVINRWSPAARWSWCVVGWLVAVGLAAYGLLLWPGLAELILVPFGHPFDAVGLQALLLRAQVTLTAVATAVSLTPIVRELRSACPRCGRHHGRSPEDRLEPTPWWGYAGGYLAILGLVGRLTPAVPDWLAAGGLAPDAPGGSAFVIFIGLMILAGTLLPLALAHRWGRLWPAWVLPWAGRAVPRWIVLGPGVMMSVGLLAYFGAGGVTATLLGRTSGQWGEALEIISYVLWGLGLGIASLSYARLTKPACPRARSRPGSR